MKELDKSKLDWWTEINNFMKNHHWTPEVFNRVIGTSPQVLYSWRQGTSPAPYVKGLIRQKLKATIEGRD